LQERALLEEEVRQLRAAVQIWKAVARQDPQTDDANSELAGQN
jgi:hypothetical protein